MQRSFSKGKCPINFFYDGIKRVKILITLLITMTTHTQLIKQKQIDDQMNTIGKWIHDVDDKTMMMRLGSFLSISTI